MRYETVVVPANHADRRLDKFVMSQRKGVPKSLVARLLRKGVIRVNGRKAKPEYRTVVGDEITLPPLTTTDRISRVPAQLTEKVNASIVDETEEWVIVDKPSGLPVHTGTGHEHGVIEALRATRDGTELELVHRIDADTSGLVLVAKGHAALRRLQDNMVAGRITRRYLALVEGAWPDSLHDLRHPLRHYRGRARVAADGQPAHTRFTVRTRIGRRATLIAAELVTGRKHQIRVHTSFAGHPIIGDRLHGRTTAPRLMLHATELVVPLTDGTADTVAVGPPADFERVIDSWRTSRRGSRRRS